MSIQSEITRLESAKADIIEAIKTQGITVPDGITLDELAELIMTIDSVRYSAQSPTEEEKAQARANIGAISENDRGIAGGIATLDDNGKVKAEQTSSIIQDISESITISLNHAGKLLKITTADIIITIPDDSDIPVGTEIELYLHVSSGTCTIQSVSNIYLAFDGTSSSARSLTLNTYGICALKKMTSATWKVSGELT